MSSNMSSDPGREYNNAMSAYNSAMDKYNTLNNQYTGNAGYQNSVSQARLGADIASRGAAVNASSTARSLGMTKSAAAALGAEQGAKGYYDAFAGQQQAAANAGYQGIAAQQNALASRQGIISTEQQEKENKYNRSWGNLGNAMGITGSFISAISDNNLKTYYKLSSKYTRNK